MFRSKSLVWLLGFGPVIVFSLSCGAVGGTNKENRNSGVTNSEAQRSLLSSPHTDNSSPHTDNSSASTPTQSGIQSKTIRNVDFKNLTYPWYPSYLKSPDGSREVLLRDGRFEAAEDLEKGVNYLLLEFDDVSYAELMSNGTEQAVIYLRGISVMNRFVGCIFIYGLDDAVPKLLWSHETGDRADGGLRKIELEGRTLIIEQYTLEGGAGLCCPKKFVRRYFQWDGRKFRNTKSEVQSESP